MILNHVSFIKRSVWQIDILPTIYICSCPATVFRCDYGACIDGDLRCNGIANCADGSDESPAICAAAPWSTTTSTTPSTITSGSSSERCKAPPQPENGQWKLNELQCPNKMDCDVAEGEELPLGSYIIYSCDPGYRLRGSAHVTCVLQGEWITIPVCTGIEMCFLETLYI